MFFRKSGVFLWKKSPRQGCTTQKTELGGRAAALPPQTPPNPHVHEGVPPLKLPTDFMDTPHPNWIPWLVRPKPSKAIIDTTLSYNAKVICKCRFHCVFLKVRLGFICIYCRKCSPTAVNAANYQARPLDTTP